MDPYEDEPLNWFVRDGAGYAHHLDYESPGHVSALCGHQFGDIRAAGPDRPARVCRACQALQPSHEAAWWRARALAEARKHAACRRVLGAERRKVTLLTQQLKAARELEAAKDALTQKLEMEVQRLRTSLEATEVELTENRTKIQRQRQELARLSRRRPSRTSSKPNPDWIARQIALGTDPRDRADSKARPSNAPAPFPVRSLLPGGLPGRGKRR